MKCNIQIIISIRALLRLSPTAQQTIIEAGYFLLDREMIVNGERHAVDGGCGAHYR